MHLQLSLYVKMAMPDSQRYPWNFCLIISVEDIVVFLGLQINSDNLHIFFCKSLFGENPQLLVFKIINSDTYTTDLPIN